MGSFLICNQARLTYIATTHNINLPTYKTVSLQIYDIPIIIEKQLLVIVKQIFSIKVYTFASLL